MSTSVLAKTLRLDHFCVSPTHARNTVKSLSLMFFSDFFLITMSQTSSFPYFGNAGQFRADGKPAESNKFNLNTLFDFSTL